MQVILWILWLSTTMHRFQDHFFLLAQVEATVAWDRSSRVACEERRFERKTCSFSGFVWVHYRYLVEVRVCELLSFCGHVPVTCDIRASLVRGPFRTLLSWRGRIDHLNPVEHDAGFYRI